MEWMLMPLRRYAEFSGRSRRKEYWMFTLGAVLLYFVLMIVMTVVGGASMMALTGGDEPGPAGLGAMIAGMGAFLVVYLIIWLALVIPTLAVTVRRLHDTDRSGWWLLAPLGCAVLYGVTSQFSTTLAMIFGVVYVATGLALLVFMFLDGTRGPNRYGEDPKGRGAAEVFA